MTIDPYAADVLTDLIPDRPWIADALCPSTDPEAFYPEKGGSTKAAKAVCNGGPGREPCPVRTECLQFALDNNETAGIWGGYSERERRQLRGPIDIAMRVRERRQQAHKMRNEGHPVKDIATHFDVTTDTVYGWLKEAAA